MVKINKIYTRGGDKGETQLVGGTKVSKDDLRVHAYGDVDELNCLIGAARTLAVEQKKNSLSEQLAKLQNELFDLGSELATQAGQEWEGMLTIEATHILRLESWIDELVKDLPELRSFVLPGGTQLNAVLHHARCVCRRAERHVVSLGREESVSEFVLQYLNRLSDLLFAMARAESKASNAQEFLWQPGKTSQ